MRRKFIYLLLDQLNRANVSDKWELS